MERSLYQKSLANVRDSFDSDNFAIRNRRKRVVLRVPKGDRLPPVIMKECYDEATGQNSFKLFKKLKKVAKKVVDAHKKVAKKVVAVHKKVAKASVKLAKKGIKLVGEATKMAVLLPLLPVIKTALKKKKISVGNNPKKLVETFYNVFIAKKKINFDSFDQETSSIAFAAIIPPVIKFVTTLIKRKKSGGKSGDPALDEAAEEGTTAIQEMEAKAAAAGVDLTDIEAPIAATALPSNIKTNASGKPDVGSSDNAPEPKAGILDGETMGISNKLIAAIVAGILLLILAKKFL